MFYRCLLIVLALFLNVHANEAKKYVLPPVDLEQIFRDFNKELIERGKKPLDSKKNIEDQLVKMGLDKNKWLFYLLSRMPPLRLEGVPKDPLDYSMKGNNCDISTVYIQSIGGQKNDSKRVRNLSGDGIESTVIHALESTVPDAVKLKYVLIRYPDKEEHESLQTGEKIDDSKKEKEFKKSDGLLFYIFSMCIALIIGFCLGRHSKN